MIHSRIEKIKNYFCLLKKGHEWAKRNLDGNYHPDEGWKLIYERSIPIFMELEKLGVKRTFSEALLVFGPLITDGLVNQFEEEN